MPPVRVPSFGNRPAPINAICAACATVVPRSPHRWDSRRDMCRLCAMNAAEAQAQRRARTLAIAEEEEERIQRGLTIRVPPRKHRICTLCNEDYIVPLSDTTANPSTRCRPCEKCERCSRCKKIKKKKRFRKENRPLSASLNKTCSECREKDATRAHQKRLQAESQGVYMRSDSLEILYMFVC